MPNGDWRTDWFERKKAREELERRLRVRETFGAQYPWAQQFLPPKPTIAPKPEEPMPWFAPALQPVGEAGAAVSGVTERTRYAFAGLFDPELREEVTRPMELFLPSKAVSPEFEYISELVTEEGKERFEELPWISRVAAEEAILLPLYVAGGAGAIRAAKPLYELLSKRALAGYAKIQARRMMTKSERVAYNAAKKLTDGKFPAQLPEEAALLQEVYGAIPAGVPVKLTAEELAKRAVPIVTAQVAKLGARQWNKMPVSERVAIVKEAGLSGKRGSAVWKNLSKEEVAGIQTAWTARTQLKPLMAVEAIPTELRVNYELLSGYGTKGVAHTKQFSLSQLKAFKQLKNLGFVETWKVEGRTWFRVKPPVTTVGVPPIKPLGTSVAPEETTKLLTAKLAEFVKTLKPERVKAELSSALIRKQQAGRLADIQEALGRGEITGGVAHKRMLATLKGKMPEAKVPISDVKFTPEEVSSLKEIIGTSPNLPPIAINKYIRLHTMQALDNLLVGKIPTERGLSLLERVFGKPFVDAFKKKVTVPATVWEGVLEAAGLIKSVRASWDLSALFRQGGTILIARPQQIPSAIKTQLKAVFSDKQALAIHDAMHATKWEGIMEEARLYRPDFWSSLAKITAREEAYVSRLARKIPGIKRSERAYVVGLEQIRTDFFIHNAEKWARMGIKANSEDYRHLAKAVNILTGRGDVRGLEQTLTALNAVLFSPRFQLSRLMTPTLLFDKSPLVRKMSAEVLAKYYGFWATILGSTAFLADVSTDPNPLSTNFGKIRYKDTWLDPLAGYAPWFRYVARLLSSPIYAIGGAISEKDAEKLYEAKIRVKSTYSDTIREADLLRVTETFARTKLSPALTPIIDLIMGETLVGKKFERIGVKEQLMEYWSPLAIQATFEAIQEEGFVGAGLAFPEYVGFGVYTIPAKDQLVGEVNARYTDYRTVKTKHNQLLEDSEWEKADKYALEHTELLYGIMYGRAATDIREIQKQIEKIEDDETMSSDEKEREIERLSVQIINLATSVLEQETVGERGVTPSPMAPPTMPSPQLPRTSSNPFIGQ